MANLSRRMMCAQSTIKPQTLIGWEIARHGGLSKVGAKKVIERVAKEGVVCTLDWLLFGNGQGPTIIPDYPILSNVLNINEKRLSITTEDQDIMKELQLFKKHYQNTIELQLPDDGMAPFFTAGDYVAGIRVHGKQINQLINYNCIVQLKNGNILFRTIKQGEDDDCFTLTCLNSQTSLAESTVHNIKLLSAGCVIWHRKKSVVV